jgi:hypothetical protein
MGRTSSLKIVTSSNNSTYPLRYNALSALEVHTAGKTKHLFPLGVLQLRVVEQLFAFSVMLEFDADGEFMMLMMMHVHHCMHIVQFLSTLDNLLMEITPNQVTPCLIPVNRNCIFDLLHPEWCYEKTWFHVAQLRELYHLLEFVVG